MQLRIFKMQNGDFGVIFVNAAGDNSSFEKCILEYFQISVRSKAPFSLRRFTLRGSLLVLLCREVPFYLDRTFNLHVASLLSTAASCVRVALFQLQPWIACGKTLVTYFGEQLLRISCPTFPRPARFLVTLFTPAAGSFITTVISYAAPILLGLQDLE